MTPAFNRKQIGTGRNGAQRKDATFFLYDYYYIMGVGAEDLADFYCRGQFFVSVTGGHLRCHAKEAEKYIDKIHDLQKRLGAIVHR